MHATHNTPHITEKFHFITSERTDLCIIQHSVQAMLVLNKVHDSRNTRTSLVKTTKATAWSQQHLKWTESPRVQNVGSCHSVVRHPKRFRDRQLRGFGGIYYNNSQDPRMIEASFQVCLPLIYGHPGCNVCLHIFSSWL